MMMGQMGLVGISNLTKMQYDKLTVSAVPTELIRQYMHHNTSFSHNKVKVIVTADNLHHLKNKIRINDRVLKGSSSSNCVFLRLCPITLP